MEILHFCPSKSFSGLEQYALEIALDQKKSGKDVGFIVYPGSSLHQECEKAQIRTVFFLYDKVQGVFGFWRDLVQILEGDHQLKALHLHMTNGVTQVALPLFWMRLRGRWTAHPKIILQVHIWVERARKDIYHRLLFSNIDEIWCSSHQAQLALQRAFPNNVKTPKIFNYGRDIEKIETDLLSRSQAREKLGLEENQRVVGTVSRIEEAKGIRELVEAMVPLLDEDKNLQLVVIGGPSPNNREALSYFSKLQEDTAKLPKDLERRILFKGQVPQSNKYLKAFDLYVLPSYLECFSLSVLDAQLAELPVVGSRSGGTPEVVKENETGWLFEPRHVGELRNSLRLALSHPDSWSRFGKNAKLRVQRDFNKKEIFKKIEGAYL